MTRKDYELVADAIARTRAEYAGAFEPDYPSEVLDDVSGRIADQIAANNPRFDRAQFLAAAGVEQ